MVSIELSVAGRPKSNCAGVLARGLLLLFAGVRQELGRSGAAAEPLRPDSIGVGASGAITPPEGKVA